MEPKRSRGFACARANGTNAGNIESRSGSERVPPTPLRNVRRSSAFFVMNIDGSLSGGSKEQAPPYIRSGGSEDPPLRTPLGGSKNQDPPYIKNRSLAA